jgi:ribosome biogenesis protein BRX1
MSITQKISTDMAAVYKQLTTGTSKSKNVAESEPQNRQRVLLLSSRGITHRYLPPMFWLTRRQRHLMNDLAALLPHSKKDAKLDTKSKLYHLNELADLYNCNNVMFFESRKHGQDLYLWLSKAPNGPSMKLHLQNCILFWMGRWTDDSAYNVFSGQGVGKLIVRDELNLTGNCLKGSRPILSFDKSFDETPSSRLMKEMIIHVLPFSIIISLTN